MKYKVMWTGTQAWASDSLILEGIVVEERDEAAGQPKPAVEFQPLRHRQRHPAKQAEDTPFGLFVAKKFNSCPVRGTGEAPPGWRGVQKTDCIVSYLYIYIFLQCTPIRRDSSARDPERREQS